MSVDELIEGYQIFKAGGANWVAGADHDVIYGPGADDVKLTPQQKARLEELGWSIDRGYDGWYHFC